MDSATYDYIVVGGGVAGLTLASRLSKLLPEASIIVVGAGSDPTVNKDVLSPLTIMKLQPSAQAWPIDVEPNPHTDNRETTVYVGKALSGSATINGGAWTRGPASDYDLWADIAGDDGWSYDRMLPYFKLTEAYNDPDGQPGQHDTAGYLPVTSIKSQHPDRHYPLREHVQKAFSEAGIPYLNDANAGQVNGLGEHVEVWHNGHRQLPFQFLDLSHLTIRDNTHVKRVLFSDSTPPRATGIELVDGTTISANREVILSAGSYHTPQLLLLSGIGPAAHLAEHSIPVIIDNPAVGSNLRDHLAIPTQFLLQPSLAAQGAAIPHPTFMANPSFFKGWQLDFIHFDTLTGSSTPHTPTLKQLNPHPPSAALVTRLNATHYETVTLYTPFPAARTGVPDSPSTATGAQITTVSVLLTPTSTGHVRLRSSTPTDPPTVDLNYLSTASDAYILRAALRTVWSIYGATPTGRATVHAELPPTGSPAIADASDDELDARVRRWCFSLDHPMGTAQMGRSAAAAGYGGAVVDAQCRVFGAEGLRVVDASVLPVPMAAHIQACVYALGERMADVIAKESLSK